MFLKAPSLTAPPHPHLGKKDVPEKRSPKIKSWWPRTSVSEAMLSNAPARIAVVNVVHVCTYIQLDPGTHLAMLLIKTSLNAILQTPNGPWPPPFCNQNEYWYKFDARSFRRQNGYNFINTLKSKLHLPHQIIGGDFPCVFFDFLLFQDIETCMFILSAAAPSARSLARIPLQFWN